MLYLIAITVFVAILLLTWAAIFPFLSHRGLVQDRLGKFAPQQVTTVDLTTESPKWYDKLSQLGSVVRFSPKEQNKYMRMLVAAGCKKESVFVFFGSKMLLACALPCAYLLYCAVTGRLYLQSQPLLIPLVLAIIGYLLPSYWLYRKFNERRIQIFHTLPDVLDLITVCVEAGLSMDAALIKTTETPQFAKDALAKEIKIATMETRAGKPRIESLKDMADRTMVDDVKAFVTMLAQTERFGTSLSQALGVHADSLRTKRRQIAEEAAAKTTIKLIFPLILFVFPALLVVILGPAFVQISKLFK